MQQFTILAVLATLTVFGLVQRASAQAVPSVIGVTAFSAQSQYMSLAGYLRWQTFKESNVWISQEESEQLVHSQVRATR
ncbi:MAG: hypothetical protein ACYDBB_08985 [Armatimonadota bacterium]